MSTHNLCFEQKCEKYQDFLSEIFHFLVVKFSVYLNRRVFVMLIWVDTVMAQVKEPKQLFTPNLGVSRTPQNPLS